MTATYDDLEQIYHQPRRLEIMTELCAGNGEATFNELKEACALTDGNLSRHLQALEKSGAIKIKKSFSGSKPLTTVRVTNSGRLGFAEYLKALEAVLKEAESRLGKRRTRTGGLVLNGLTTEKG